MANPGLSLTKVSYVILFVKDMARAVPFYRDVLGIPVRFESPEWTELETQGITIALHRTDGEVPFHQPALPEVVFAASDVRAAHATLKDRKARIHDLKAVHEAEDAVGVSAELHDPDGNRLSIYGLVPKSEWTGGAGKAC
jgi:lactoylglutathione lyase